MKFTTQELAELELNRIDTIQVAAYSIPDDIFENLKQEVGIKNENEDGFFFWVEEVENFQTVSANSKEYVKAILEASGVPDAPLIEFIV